MHLHIELDPETEVFQYRAIVNGEHTVLHRNDWITFRGKHPFAIRFTLDSPFTPEDKKSFNAEQESDEWILPAHVRVDAPLGNYPYTVEMSKLRRTFSDEHVQTVQGDPEIIIDR